VLLHELSLTTHLARTRRQLTPAEPGRVSTKRRILFKNCEYLLRRRCRGAVLEERNVRVTASFVELFIPHARARRPAPWPLAGSCSLALHHSRSARRALIDMPSRDRKIESDDSRIADAVMRVGLSFFFDSPDASDRSQGRARRANV